VRSVCPVCGVQVVSSIDGQRCYHLRGAGRVFTDRTWSDEPWGHAARLDPNKLIHTCTAKDDDCPLCRQDKQWHARLVEDHNEYVRKVRQRLSDPSLMEEARASGLQSEKQS
jgi:hypothetical protein